MSKTILIALVVGIVALFLSPILGQTGSWSELRRWDAPSPNPFGHDRDLFASIEQSYSYFDVLKLYPTERLLVTDGGYSYIHYFKVPGHLAKPWVDDCQVIWSGDEVIFTSATGLTISVDSEAVINHL